MNAWYDVFSDASGMESVKRVPQSSAVLFSSEKEDSRAMPYAS